MTETEHELKRVVVVGGGTAGWLTALYAKMVLPKTCNVILVESSDIGILGAGEGTTPHFIEFLDFLRIPVSRLVKDADATIKNANKFTNWKNDGKSYYHSFGIYNNLGFTSCNFNTYFFPTNIGILKSVIEDNSLDNFDFARKVSEENKAVFVYSGRNDTMYEDPISAYSPQAGFAVHFNAANVAKVLSEIAIERGVIRIEGKVKDVILDKNEDVSSIGLETDTPVTSIDDIDVVFDCSGFHRRIIGKVYDAKWKSHGDKLPVNAALPFFLPPDKDKIPPYTESIAMNYGWMWKIPLQSRFGCGYVYDSSLISKEEAQAEVEKMLGYEIEPVNHFKFDAGYYETPWVNNCIAIGLSAGFIEPLEATSIWSTKVALINAFGNLDRLARRDRRTVDEFNKKYAKISEEILSFVYFHYMTERTDTDFWKKFTVKNAPESLKETLDIWKDRVPEYQDFNEQLFGLDSWMQIAVGIDKHNQSIISQSFRTNQVDFHLDRAYKNVIDFQNRTVEACEDHAKFLEALKR